MSANEKFYKAFVAVDAEDVPHVFTIPDGVFADRGDLLEHDGEMFVVTDNLYLPLDSAEYRLIMDLVIPKKAKAVYRRMWEDGNE